MNRLVLVVDGANVVGAKPDGWWKDRGKAAARLHGRLAVADTSHDEIVLVLEGQARGGVPQGKDGHLRTVHASRDGDAAIVEAVRAGVDKGDQVVAITADRGLMMRVEGAGGRVMSPTWLIDLVGY